jgi:hypothetical protein
MTKTPHNIDNKDDDTVSKDYATALEKALQESKKPESSLHQLLDDASDELYQYKQYIKRDLLDAAHHLTETGEELKDWLGFDLLLIKNELWQQFTEAADQTTLELLKLKNIAANAEYHTGEVTGLGTLSCDQCQAQLHFHKPGRIPPCAKCHGTNFHRLNRGGIV